MTRLHTDPVEVRSERDLPAQFRWRGRLYLVQEVLARWTESGQWWRTPVVRSLTSGDALAGLSDGGGAVTGMQIEVDDGEREWWRVEAGSGRLAAFRGDDPADPPDATAGTGVFDLCYDAGRGSWSLARVLD